MAVMNRAEYLFDNAAMAMRAGRRDDAADLAWETIRLKRDHAYAWMLKGDVEVSYSRYANAMLCYGFAVQFAPESHEIWCNRGICATGARMYPEAVESFERSLALQPSFEGHYNYGNTLCSIGNAEKAVEHYRAAQAFDPDHKQLHANLGVALIGLGRWQEGFAEYRHRFNAPGFPPRIRFDYPIWHGEPLEGKTILLYVEQGFGDEIQSLRFAEYVKVWDARVILSVRPSMFRLARDYKFHFPPDAVILQYDEPPWKPDYMCALLDVPGWLKLSPADIQGTPYLRAEDRGYMLKFPPGLRVGICWASGERRDMQPSVWETAKQKTLRFADLAPLARSGVVLVNLQLSHKDHDALRELGVIDPMQGVTDFADTAWIISQLDLVVTVDTAVAHLAGALGRPVWNLVRFDALWPWMRETGKTCWYDSMTIYRQPEPFNWREPLGRLMADFGKLLAEREKAAA